MSTKRKDNGNGEHPTPDSTTKEKTTFCPGDEVLMQRKDGNFYLGTVVKIDLSREQCQVKFGDDTETWSSFTRLTKLSTGLGIMCVKCKVSQTDADNDIIICDKCSRGYHQKCHVPQIADEYLKEESKWECIRCCDPPGKRSLPPRKSSISVPPQPPLPSAQTSPVPPSPQQKPPLQSKVQPQLKPLSLHAKPSVSPQIKPSPSTPQTKPSTPLVKPSPAQPSPQTKSPAVVPSKPPTVSQAKSPAVVQTKLPVVAQVKSTAAPQVKSPTVTQAKPPCVAQVKPSCVTQAKPPSVTQAKSPIVTQTKNPSVAQTKPSIAVQGKPPSIAQPKPCVSQVKSPLISQIKTPVVLLTKTSILLTNNKSTTVSQTKPTVVPTKSPVTTTQSKISPSVKSSPETTVPESQPKSIPPTPPTTPTLTQQTSIPIATEAQKKKLPYNPNDLHWDMQRRTNTENKYCYCGGPGKWFLKMLQCGRCRQWFHGRCIASLRYPLFYGDRFYVFVCTLCNSGKEFLRRLEIKWVDLVHLAAFNLTLKTGKKYMDVDEDLLRFINTNWNYLQLPPKILETTEKREIVISVLTGNRNRFKAAREVQSRKTKWGLKVRVPPPTPVFSLPPNKPLSDQVLSDAWNNSARLKFLPPPPRNSLPNKPEDDFDLSDLKNQLPGSEILHIETSFLVLPKGVPASGHNVCIKSSTPMFPEARAIKRRLKEQGLENERLRRSRKARRLLRSSLNKESGGGKERQDLPPTPPSSESNPEVATAQPDTSGDETSSRGTLDSIIPPPVDFEGRNNPFLPIAPVLRPVKRRLSEKDIIVTSTGEVKRRKVRRSMKLAARSMEGGGRGKLKKMYKSTTPTTSPVKNQPSLSLEELKSSVNQYFGAVNRIASGEKFSVRAKRVSLDGRVQYLIDWGTPT